MYFLDKKDHLGKSTKMVIKELGEKKKTRENSCLGYVDIWFYRNRFLRVGFVENAGATSLSEKVVLQFYSLISWNN